jgi:predicted transcriptional regulator
MEKHWVNIFKVLGNINRLKIMKMLASGKIMNVTEVADELKISLKSTSKHLIILERFDLLESEGKSSRVYYSLNKNMPNNLKEAIKLFC